MSEAPKGNEIDEIFNKAIEPVSTEPSEEFWRKAAEDVISRGSKSNEKKATRWRTIAFILAAGILVLGYFAFKMQIGLNNVEQQVTTIKNTQNQNSEKINTVLAENNTANTSNQVAVNTSIYDKQKQNINSARQTNLASNNVKERNSSSASHDKLNKSVNASLAFNKQTQHSKQHKKSVGPIVVKSNNNIIPEKQETTVNKLTEQENLNTKEVAVSTQNTIQKPPVSSQSKSIEYIAQPIKLTSTILTDTSKAIQNAGIPLHDTSSRFSISAFFSPDFMMGYMYKCAGPTGEECENSIKTEEKQNFSYTVGAKAEYQLSSRFSIAAGIAYQVFSFNSNPGSVYAQKQSDGTIRYSFTTSSGVVECPYYYGTPTIGDSLKMNASSTRTYLEIPLQLKYFLANKDKYNFYLVGGMEANIRISEETTMNWKTYYWNESGTSIVYNTEGSENFYFAYYIGIGASYKIGKYLSLYAEPGLHEAITSIDDNTSVITYPRLMSITAGLTWHLR